MRSKQYAKDGIKRRRSPLERRVDRPRRYRDTGVTLLQA